MSFLIIAVSFGRTVPASLVCQQPVKLLAKSRGLFMLGVSRLGGPRAGSPGVRVPALAGLHQPPASSDGSINPALRAMCASFRMSCQTEIRALPKGRGILKVWVISPFGGKLA